jgi:hypothetical protein
VQEARKIALLIDCDNVSHTAIEGVLEELAKHGIVNVRHAHGDWNNPLLSGWVGKLHPHAIRPMQQFAYSKGKNATDSAMIIDAMDLLYSNNVDAFALMTSAVTLLRWCSGFMKAAFRCTDSVARRRRNRSSTPALRLSTLKIWKVVTRTKPTAPRLRHGKPKRSCGRILPW